MKKTTVNHKHPYADFDTPLTTGHVASECKVSARTVVKWITTGRLKAYSLPGSNDRRVIKSDLLRFMMDHGLRPSLGLVTCVKPQREVVVVYGVEYEGYVVGCPDVLVFTDPFEFGCYIATHPITVAVLGDGNGLTDLARAVRVVRDRFPECVLRVVIDGSITASDLRAAGLGDEPCEYRPMKPLVAEK